MEHLLKDLVELYSTTSDQNSRHKTKTKTLEYSDVLGLKLLRTQAVRGGTDGDVIHLGKKRVVFVFLESQEIQKDWIIKFDGIEYGIDQIEIARGVNGTNQKRAVTIRAE